MTTPADLNYVPPAGTVLRRLKDGKILHVHAEGRDSDSFFVSEHPCDDGPEGSPGIKTSTGGFILGWSGRRADGRGYTEVWAVVWDFDGKPCYEVIG